MPQIMCFIFLFDSSQIIRFPELQHSKGQWSFVVADIVLWCRQKPFSLLPSHSTSQTVWPLTVARGSTQTFYNLNTAWHGSITLEQETSPGLDCYLPGQRLREEYPGYRWHHEQGTFQLGMAAGSAGRERRTWWRANTGRETPGLRCCPLLCKGTRRSCSSEIFLRAVGLKAETGKPTPLCHCFMRVL